MKNSTTSNEAIVISSVTKQYKDVRAVDDISLHIDRGELYGFLGLNGAGKTTTIRMMLGMIRPDDGHIELFGTKIHPGIREIWRHVGYMVETPHAYPDLTVRENLEMVRRLRKLGSGEVDRIIGQLSLTRDADRKAGKLSLGNRQRLGLAKAMIHRPELLILDEPANGLDPAGIVEIRNLLRDLAEKQGVTIFMSSHILSEVNRLATRIGVIHRGRLVREIEAEELAEQENRRLVVESHDIPAASKVLAGAGISSVSEQGAIVITDSDALEHPDDIAVQLVNAGVPPTRLAVEQGDLESYFLDLVGLNGKAEVTDV